MFYWLIVKHIEDSLFKNIEYRMLSSWSLIALLRSTYCFKSKIPDWESLYNYTKDYFEESGLDTKKELYDSYLKEFDKGSISVIIGGVALVEALSLYRLSTIIDTDLSLSENSIIQLIGRLKRFNPEICNKQKVYLKLVYKGISEKKFRNTTLSVLKTMDYVKVQPTKSTNTYDLVGLFQT